MSTKGGMQIPGPWVSLKVAQDLQAKLHAAETGKAVALEWNQKACKERDEAQRAKEELFLENYSLRQELSLVRGWLQQIWRSGNNDEEAEALMEQICAYLSRPEALDNT